MENRIRALIKQIIPVCESWIQKAEDGSDRFVDPNDCEEISAHYGATHAAASFIIWGKTQCDEDLYKKGVTLMESLLSQWRKNMTLPTFHFDFNNFALVLAADYVDAHLRERIKQTILNTADSNHNTVNWLPMRWAVNKKRNEWTANIKYQSTIDYCRTTISKATNADGGIEDRLPYGMSFNLQYDLATVAGMQYLNVHGEDLDLSKELGFLLNAVSPDGDINYQGRGTNQIFGWGLWIYLLVSSGQKESLVQALDYLSPRLKTMLENKNLMLNKWDGKEKYLWWDYHYASVYTAHCMLWLILAYIDSDKKLIIPTFSSTIETGLHIYKSENFFVSWFEGRTEYLAEKGPAIAAIWSKKQGMICKGTFGPWQGPFGNKYIYENVVLKNFCGLLAVKRNKDWSKNRFIHRLYPKLITEPKLCLKPLFVPIFVKEINSCLEITLTAESQNEFIVNIPTKKEILIDVSIGDKSFAILCVEAIRNHYNWVWLHQTRVTSGSCIKLKIQ